MGFRTWNAYHGDINDTLVRRVMQALVSRQRQVNGVATSLADLGYGRVGIDDGWQACHTGYMGTVTRFNKSFHALDGTPLVNKTRFPNVKALVQHGHKQGLKMGWYTINCICMDTYTIQFDADKDWSRRVYEAEVEFLLDAGFDGVKIDNCGDDQGIGFQMMIETINKSGKPLLIENSDQGNSNPRRGVPRNASFCPGNTFRTGGDIIPDFSVILDKLNRTRQYQDLDDPISRPDCWAYPDMLEVGNLLGDFMHTQSRTHFGAWCIVSSPLILSLDVTNDALVDSVWDILSNDEAIAVNQAWAGHPGRLLRGTATYQLWAKKLPGGVQAILVINSGPAAVGSMDLLLGDLGLDAEKRYAVRDIWAKTDLLEVASGSWKTGDISAYDSVFVRFTPVEIDDRARTSLSLPDQLERISLHELFVRSVYV
jgi:alpha-galactosidase